MMKRLEYPAPRPDGAGESGEGSNAHTGAAAKRRKERKSNKKEHKRFLLRYDPVAWREIEDWASEHSISVQQAVRRFIGLGLLAQSSYDSGRGLLYEDEDGELRKILLPPP